MSDWRPLTSHQGIQTEVLFDNEGKVLFRSRQLVDPILDANKAAYNEGVNRRSTWRKYASIPLNIVHKWLNEGIDIYSGEQQDALARKLNDPAYRYLRTAPGCIGVSNGVAR
jgi:hypothetical protein